MSKSSIDANVDDFYITVDLSIDPPLADAVTRGFSSTFLSVRRIKDEDVKVIDGEMKIVSTDVTGVSATSDGEFGDYANFKTDVAKLAQTAKTNSSHLNGYVLVRTDEGEIFRIRSIDNAISLEEPVYQWPDGTTTPVRTEA